MDKLFAVLIRWEGWLCKRRTVRAAQATQLFLRGHLLLHTLCGNGLNFGWKRVTWWGGVIIRDKVRWIMRQLFSYGGRFRRTWRSCVLLVALHVLTRNQRTDKSTTNIYVTSYS